MSFDPHTQVHEIRIREDGAIEECFVPAPLGYVFQAPTAETQWSKVRIERDARMNAFAWRLDRHARQVRLGLPTTDDIGDLDAYMQALADITQQRDPFAIEWPTPP